MLAFLGLWLLGLVWWQTELLTPEILPDETTYVSVAETVLAGKSPYDAPVYNYPPPYALLAARAVEAWGTAGFLRAQRFLNLTGACLAIWCSLLGTGWPLGARLLIGGLLLTLADSIVLGLETGNIALLITGLAIAALTIWHRRPVAAGVLLGLGVVLKPVTFLAPVLLLVHRPSDATRRHLAAGTTTLVTIFLLLLAGWRYIPGFLSSTKGIPTGSSNLSLHRLLHILGVELPWQLLAALLAGATLLFVLWRPLQRLELLDVVAVSSLLTLPRVWLFTTLLVLPLQLAAVNLAWQEWRARRRSADSGQRGGRRWPLTELTVVLAVLAIFLGRGVGAVDTAPLWLLVPSLSVPLFAPLFLLIYTLRRPRQTSSSTAPRDRAADLETDGL